MIMPAMIIATYREGTMKRRRMLLEGIAILET